MSRRVRSFVVYLEYRSTDCDDARERRWVEGETREGYEKNKTRFHRWVPVVDARGEDVTSAPRGEERCPYVLAEDGKGDE